LEGDACHKSEGRGVDPVEKGCGPVSVPDPSGDRSDRSHEEERWEEDSDGGDHGSRDPAEDVADEGTDALESMGHSLVFGNNASINLEPDTREETDRLFAGLSEGGKVTTPLTEMFWGGYFGSLTDRFGVQWMFNYTL
jgi:predicted 3-demethylubiquinone-9 3-methyltransferase (glyoxalase superfamily)